MKQVDDKSTAKEQQADKNGETNCEKHDTCHNDRGER